MPWAPVSAAVALKEAVLIGLFQEPSSLKQLGHVITLLLPRSG